LAEAPSTDPIATPGKPRSGAGRSFRDTLQRPREVLPQKREFALDSAGTADHHMIGPGIAVRWDQFSRESPESALHSISGDGVADPAGDCEADAHPRVLVTAIADEKNKSRHCGAPSGVRRKEIRALLDDG
jgi:hypothetical protein